VVNTWNVRDEFKHLNLDEIKAEHTNQVLPFSVCALNLTGDLNLGMILRTACLTGAERAFIFGKKTYDRRSTVGAQNYLDIVKVSGIDDTGELCKDKFYDTMNEYEYIPVFVEQGGTPIELHSIVDTSLKPCYIFGNEGIGIPSSLISSSKRVSLSQVGVLRSYNVSSAAAIVMYHVMNQHLSNQ